MFHGGLRLGFLDLRTLQELVIGCSHDATMAQTRCRQCQTDTFICPGPLNVLQEKKKKKKGHVCNAALHVIVPVLEDKVCGVALEGFTLIVQTPGKP